MARKRDNIQMKPELSVDEFNAYLKRETDELRQGMAEQELSITMAVKAKVDLVCADLVTVLQNACPDEDEPTRVLIANRAVGYVHLIVGRWFAEVNASAAILKRERVLAVEEKCRELMIQNDALKDTLGEVMQTLKEQALASIPKKYHAKKRKKTTKKAKKK